MSQKDFSFSVEIILLINNSTDAPSSIIKKNQNTYNNLKLFALQNNHCHIHLIPVYLDDLDPKHAGVGWARKLGMDLALERFKKGRLQWNYCRFRCRYYCCKKLL